MELSTVFGLLVLAGIGYAAFRIMKARANRKPGSGRRGTGGGGDGTEHF